MMEFLFPLMTEKLSGKKFKKKFTNYKIKKLKSKSKSKIKVHHHRLSHHYRLINNLYNKCTHFKMFFFNESTGMIWPLLLLFSMKVYEYSSWIYWGIYRKKNSSMFNLACINISMMMMVWEFNNRIESALSMMMIIIIYSTPGQ